MSSVITAASAATRSRAGRFASLNRDLEPGDPRLLDAQRLWRESQLEDHIRQVVASAPPLTEGQRARLAELLAPIRRGGDVG